jgi:ArsR family transcriptional regulator, cadmium/lead-responsive transcriptional repressor
MSTATRKRLPQGEGESLWAAIGEPSRRLLVDVLLVRGESTPSALANEVPFTRQAVSKHLDVLARAGLVDGRREGREMRWSIRADRLDAATREMRDVADNWDRRLRLIKQIAEEIHDESRRAAESSKKNTKRQERS